MATKEGGKRRKKEPAYRYHGSPTDSSEAVSETRCVAQAKKFFYDWLDRERPWNKHKSAYKLMEAVVEKAADVFAGEWRPTVEQYNERERQLIDITTELDDHPKDYNGPCNCADCRYEGA